MSDPNLVRSLYLDKVIVARHPDSDKKKQVEGTVIDGARYFPRQGA